MGIYTLICKGCTALEYEMLRIGAGKELVQSPNDPYVFFQQVRGQAGYIGDCVERIQTFCGGELEELSHGLRER